MLHSSTCAECTERWGLQATAGSSLCWYTKPQTNNRKMNAEILRQKHPKPQNILNRDYSLSWHHIWFCFILMWQLVRLILNMSTTSGRRFHILRLCSYITAFHSDLNNGTALVPVVFRQEIITAAVSCSPASLRNFSFTSAELSLHVLIATRILSPLCKHTQHVHLSTTTVQSQHFSQACAGVKILAWNMFNSLGFYKLHHEPLQRIPRPGSDPRRRHLWRSRSVYLNRKERKGATF